MFLFFVNTFPFFNGKFYEYDLTFIFKNSCEKSHYYHVYLFIFLRKWRFLLNKLIKMTTSYKKSQLKDVSW